MSYDKKAVHFGGGNIGRGFVAEFFHNSGYEVVFVDVMDSIIEALQKQSSYTVTEIGDDGERVFTIDHYRALNSKHEMEKVVHEIATADVVTCAVGPNILKFVAEPVAKAIDARTLDFPLAVIACENAINATTTWKGFIEPKLSEDSKKNLDKKARFANSAIDRIVPVQDKDAGLNVKIEKFHEWCVEQTPFENGGKKPDVKGIHYVDDLEPYIERKLFTVNTAHATAAYWGHQRKKEFIHEVLQDAELHEKVRAAVKETASLIVKKHKVDPKEQEEYVESILKRISNPVLKDNVERVGRAPLRKLSRKERFVGPAAQAASGDHGDLSYDALLSSIEQAYMFQDVDGDEESAELAKTINSLSAEEVVSKVNGLDKNNEKEKELFNKIVAIVEKVQASKK